MHAQIVDLCIGAYVGAGIGGVCVGASYGCGRRCGWRRMTIVSVKFL